MTGQEALDRLNACATVQDVVALAEEAGFEITEDRARALLDQRGELSDAALAGGSGGFHALGDRAANVEPASLDEMTPPNFFSETLCPASASPALRQGARGRGRRRRGAAKRTR